MSSQHILLNRRLSQEENLENLATYIQGISIAEQQQEEHRTHIVRRSLLEKRQRPTGSTLALVTLFNILGQHVGIDNLAAVRCEDSIYFSSVPVNARGASYSIPVRKISDAEHQRLTRIKMQLTTHELIALLARETAKRYELQGLQTRAARFYRCAAILEELVASQPRTQQAQANEGNAGSAACSGHLRTIAIAYTYRTNIIL